MYTTVPSPCVGDSTPWVSC